MNPLRIALLLLALSIASPAQLPSRTPPPPIKGAFYVSVDDACTIFINGQQVYETGIGESRSPEMDLRVGDRLVVALKNKTAGRHFEVLFASSDGKSVVSFRRHDFKIVPEINVTDFTPEQFQKWTKFAREERPKKQIKLPVKSYSEFLWGDMDQCLIATQITPQMVSQKPD